MQINEIYFSPTGTTKKIVRTISRNIKEELNSSTKNIDLTNLESRKKEYKFTKEDITIIGFPVYYGRVPTILNEVINNIKGENTKTIIIGVYGNRDYDDALLEIKNNLEKNGLNIIAAGAFIGEHSFSDKLAANRPDMKDLGIASDFASKIIKKLETEEEENKLEITGNYPYKEFNEISASPKTTDDCIKCLACVQNCPTEIINSEDPKNFIDKNGCICCCACVKVCPTNAKYFDDERVVGAKTKLESICKERKEPKIFI
ncbi:MAG: EFR1 family ferrodoxin [Methanobacteriaceae archaeon]|nr:EFR1 family ferrodoxin [Methanobacteriaceae archaeon]